MSINQIIDEIKSACSLVESLKKDFDKVENLIRNFDFTEGDKEIKEKNHQIVLEYKEKLVEFRKELDIKIQDVDINILKPLKISNTSRENTSISIENNNYNIINENKRKYDTLPIELVNDQYASLILENNYYPEKLIGKGGSSNVYKAINKYSNKTFALKLIYNEQFEKYCQKEYDALTELNSSEYIIECYEIIKILSPKLVNKNLKSLSIIVLEHFEGETLGQKICNTSLDNKKIFKYFKQIVEAVKFIHSKNYAHRDLKPDNILINSEDKIKIIDFTGAKNFGVDEHTKIGYYDYMAPELLIEDKFNINKCDLYSLGVILYYLVYGEKPYHIEKLDRVNQEFFNKVFNSINYELKMINKNLKALIKSLITFKEKRFSLDDVIKSTWYYQMNNE